MVRSHKLSRKVLRVALFALAVCMGFLGFFLVFDSFIPREKPVSGWIYVVQFLVGVMFLTLAAYLGRRNRLNWKTDEQVSGAGGKPELKDGK